MAKIEAKLEGNFDEWLQKLDKKIYFGSDSASREGASDFSKDSIRCSVRVYERYSFTGRNRVSLTVVLCQADDDIHLTAITSGGSQGVFLKINTIGENSFLSQVEELLTEEKIKYKKEEK